MAPSLGDIGNTNDALVMAVLMFLCSSTMRALHSQSTISGEHECAAKFLDLRDQTKRNADEYVDKVLPKLNRVVEKIKTYAFEIKACDFEAWEESLEQTRGDLMETERASKFLMRERAKMIDVLKRNKDDADICFREMERVKDIYEEREKELVNAASEHLEKREFYQRLGCILCLPTVGVGTQWARTKANQEQGEHDKCCLKAEASKTNLEIITEAVSLTNKVIIPSINIFLDGHRACNDFLKTTVSMLSSKGREDQKDSIRKYFLAMKKHVVGLESDCLEVIKSFSRIRTDLKSIKSERDNKNFVDQCAEEQLAPFKDSESEPMGFLCELCWTYTRGFSPPEV